MNEIITFKRISNQLPAVIIGEIIWCNYYPEENHQDFIKVPIKVLKIYNDGSWDGELEQAEA